MIYNLSDLQKITGQQDVFIYHGNLSPEALSDPRFIGLALYPQNLREIKCNLNNRIPLPDNCIDAFQSEDVIEHIETDKTIFCLNEIYRILKPIRFVEFLYLIIILLIKKEEVYMIMRVIF